MTVKEDIRIQKTRQKLFDAYIDILKTTDSNDVTVQILAGKAQINRVTFYKHYQNFANFHSQFIEHHILTIYEFMRPLNYQPYTRGFEQQALSDLFSFIQEHGTTYTVLFTSPHIPEFNQALLSFFQQKLTQHTDELSRFDFPGVGVNRLVVAWYGVSALLGTIIMWVQSGYPFSPQQLANMFCKLAPNAEEK
ncbi:TetR/AcrR family transcriptional regulator [Metasolibacillus fluoroglycofenilyticus]|uniref:TetR/AcrR family transcriptional regulator n=1 Tax=Metasolibacillus fluoroglycofenilyticus TaxID=1239396 RepID=UPI000D34FDF9|nr:TetR-like C-terminal domain-containing protein [Metasolibacillus fluoroglycofenilyticus]